MSGQTSGGGPSCGQSSVFGKAGSSSGPSSVSGKGAAGIGIAMGTNAIHSQVALKLQAVNSRRSQPLVSGSISSQNLATKICILMIYKHFWKAIARVEKTIASPDRANPLKSEGTQIYCRTELPKEKRRA